MSDKSFESILEEVLSRVVRCELEKFKPTHIGPEELYTPREVAERLKVSKNWIDERIRRKQIKVTYLGRYPRFTKQQIQEFLQSVSGNKLRAAQERRSRVA